VLLAALMDGRDAAGPLARIHGAQRCAQSYLGLCDQNSDHRRAVTLTLSRRLFNPVPANLHRVDPSWIHHLLQQQSSAVARVVLDALPTAMRTALDLTTDPVTAPIPRWVRPHLCRFTLGSLESMPPRAHIPRPGPEDLAALSHVRLLELLESCGAVVLAQLVRRSQDPQLSQQVGARLPRAGRSSFQQALQLELDLSPAVYREARPGTLLGSGVASHLPALALAALAPTMQPHARRQLAQRLPRPMSLTLWELATDAIVGPCQVLEAAVRLCPAEPGADR